MQSQSYTVQIDSKNPEVIMNPELDDISQHILDLGVGVLAQAQRNAFYTGYDVRLDEGVFAVMQAAQAAELIIKAAIAEQHPLLIFSDLPRSNRAMSESLSLKDLFENSRTIQYFELPEKLWAVTGFKIEDTTTFQNFGRLRNCIQHFTTPDKDLRAETSKFIYKIIDPILAHFWNGYAVNYVDLDDYLEDFFELLSDRGLKVRYPESLKIYAELN